MIDRRSVVMGALAAGLAPLAARSEGRWSEPIADMHAHLFFMGPHPAQQHPLGPAMAAGGATLVAWSLVGDLPWITTSPTGLRQKAIPERGRATSWLKEEIGRAKRHAADQGLRIATTPGDIARAAKGEPHVVLAVEGANFLDDDPDGLKLAYDAGVRHVQLVHYTRNGLADFQTEASEHNGLTATGRRIVEDCNRLGMLIDAAHATEQAVAQVLEISKAPIVWSHGSVTDKPSLTRDRIAWKARKLSLGTAKAIAAKGGVVGLWGLRSDVGGTLEDYTARLLEMAHWIGDEHVAFGSDMNALTNSPVPDFASLRRAHNMLERRGLNGPGLKAVSFGNYARVLGQAMTGAHA